MASWATDDEYAAGLGISPVTAPQAPPFKTPPANPPRSSRRSVTPPGPASSPSRMADEPADRSPSRGSTNDESISILDPRRFTPTLHANLVSEILALRRDQEEKTKQIESLELILDAVKGEQERLQGSLTEASKESRSLKRQLSLLEGGTSSALGQLQRERDEAVDSTAEIKRRLEAAQKKIRIYEDDSQRVHDLWAQEKTGWEDERRKFQRQMHVAESRLKAVLDEVALFQGAQATAATHGPGSAHDSDGEESCKDHDARSVRTMSITNSIRQSFYSPGPRNGHSLADELSFVDDQTDADGRESVLSNYTIPTSPGIHRRNQSLESLRLAGSVARARLFTNQQPAVLETPGGKQEGEPRPASSRAAYTDTGIQYSQPPSPVARSAKPATPDPAPRARAPEVEEIEANQRRKRVSVNRTLRIEPPKPDLKMVSAAAQTTEEPLSPPRTPKTPWRDFTPPSESQLALMLSSATQTDEPLGTPSRGRLAPPSPPLQIPTISIQPPRSRPSTPREPRLPQHCKDFGCQVNLSPVPTCDAVVQTEGIQIDKRLARLPPHLRPSAISSRPTSPNVRSSTPVPGSLPARNPRRLTQGGDAPETPPSPVNSHVEEDDFYEPHPGLDEDDGPPLSSRATSTRRSRRLSSLFAGFDTASSDGMDEFGDGDLSDSEFRTALSAPKPQSKSSRPTRRGSFGVGAHHAEEPSTSERGAKSELYSTFSLVDRESRFGKNPRRLSRTYEKSPPPPPPAASSRDGALRRTALIQGGIANHRNRSRSPSLPESGYPPFPIPTRASSRKPAVRTSTPSDGRGSPTRGGSWLRRGSSRSSHRAYNLRKVRSAAALPRNSRHRRQGSRSPPPLSPSAETPESGRLPPLPKNDITTPRNREIGSRRHRHELSTNTDRTNNPDGAPQTSGVVDAIAHTMVGEWMLKYVRRRRSFGVPENTGRDDSSNDRHKRWVWLAPYERAILWSSKQPSSGSALMGKTGRKLTIQSVLDVKDDNPPPKVMSSVFNRSILILTPQRALKFTAVTAERHYLWLTALSFLAHSSQAVPDIFATSQVKNHEQQQQQQQQQQALPEFEMPRTRFRRGGIRDSIRLAKVKTGSTRTGVPSAPSSKMGDVTSFRRQDSLAAIPACHSREHSQEAAEAPFIPRFSERASNVGAHGRKRSNTGGHVAPPLSFRGFSGPLGGGAHHLLTNSTANASIGTANSSDVYPSQASTNTTWNMVPSSSQPTSEASSRPKNFFDAIGTMRMEAFISPLSFSHFGEPPDEHDEHRQTARRRSKELRRRSSRNRARGHVVSRGREDFFGRGRALEEDFFRDDPFKGF